MVSLTFLVAVYAVCLSARQASAPAFGFVLEYGYFGDSLDTWKGSFTRDSLAPGHSSSIDLRLSDEELKEIRERLRSIDFWNPDKYPSEFITLIIPGRRFTSTHPHETFSFAVTENGTTKKLKWNDEIDVAETTFKPAVELRALFHRIRDVVESKPEFKKLGPRTMRPR